MCSENQDVAFYKLKKRNVDLCNEEKEAVRLADLGSLYMTKVAFSLSL